MDMDDYVPALKPKKCCVSNCTKFSRRHRFPKRNVDVFNKWLEIIKPPNYTVLNRDQIYNKYYVCEEHFDSECIVPGTKRGLKATAIPTINIPSKLLHSF